MKMSLLDMVNSILSDMDSEAVNTLSDTIEANQIASVIRDTYYQMVAVRDIPEHKQLLKITAASDSTTPTEFTLEPNLKRISALSYNVDTGGGTSWRVLSWCEPEEFLKLNTEGTVVGFYKISTDRMPTYYTSFDDNTIVCDSYDATIDTTLQESKVRAFGYVIPDFTMADTFVPDLQITQFPELLAQAKSTCFSIFKTTQDPKIEQAARRMKVHAQNDRNRIQRENKRPSYGRN